MGEKYNILVCDDEKEITDAIEIYLTQEGYNVYKAYDGRQAVAMLDETIHLLIIDLMMPGMDGMSAVLKVRKEKKSSIPIIILSAKSQDTDKIMGLNYGADDYVTKPFSPLELIARVKSQLRRYTSLGTLQESETGGRQIFKSGGLVIDDDKKEVSVDGKAVRLTRIEYNILLFLLQNKGKVFSIDQIYEKIWNEEAFCADNTVTVHIRHIREKIEIDPKNPKYLKVMWGIGYKVDDIPD